MRFIGILLTVAIIFSAFISFAQTKQDSEKKVAAPKQEAPQVTTPSDYQLYLKSGDRDAKWNEYIEPAFSSFDSENYDTAAIFLKKAYEKGCRDPLVLFRLGIYQENRRQFKDAAMLLAEAADGFPKRYPNHPLNSSIPKHAGRVLYQIDNYEKAFSYLQKALEYEPNDFMILLMLGQISRNSKQYKESRIYFERALLAKPPEGTTPDPRRTLLDELIILTFELKDLNACQQYVNIVLSSWPQDPIANSYRSRLDRERYLKQQDEVIKKMVQ